MTEFEKMPDAIVEDSEEEIDTEDEEAADAEHQENEVEDETPQAALDRMQRESVAVGNAITGPAGVWRKTRYGSWVMVSQRN